LRLRFWFFRNRIQDFSEDVQDKFTTSVANATDVTHSRVKIKSIIEKQDQSLATIINVDFGVRVPANNPAKVSCVIVCVLFDCIVPLIIARRLFDCVVAVIVARSVTDRFIALNLFLTHYQAIFGGALCFITSAVCSTSLCALCFYCLQHIFGLSVRF